MAKKVLLGVKKFSSAKSGVQKNYEVIVVSGLFSEREVANGCFGHNSEEIFLPESLHGRLTSVDCGKEIDLKYDISGSKAYLVGFDILK